MLDAVVIGGGPVGSRVAAQLAGLGHKVAVLEQRSAAGQKVCCTGIISRECASYLGVPAELAFRQVSRARILSPSGQVLDLERGEPQAWVLNRSSFDRWLAQRAADAGVEYHFNFKAAALSFSGEGVLVVSDPPVRRLKARAAVLASGFNSPLVENCGLGRPARCVAGVQARVELKQIPEIEVYFDQQLAPEFFAWIVPISDQAGLIGLLSNRAPAQRLRNWLDELKDQGRIQPDGAEVHHWGIPLRPLTRTYSERVLVVGDAAGQAKPTTGGGIYFGVLSADLAAETLHNSIERNDCSARALAAYQRKWQAKLKRELQLEYLARRLYKYLDNERLDRVVARLKSSAAFGGLLRDSRLSFDWHGDLILQALKFGLADQLAAWARKPAELLKSLERTTK